jgi:hypothetical protein
MQKKNTGDVLEKIGHEEIKLRGRETQAVMDGESLEEEPMDTTAKQGKPDAQMIDVVENPNTNPNQENSEEQEGGKSDEIGGKK